MDEQNDHTSIMLKELSEERKRKQIQYDSDETEILLDSAKKKKKYNYNISQLVRDEVDSELNSLRQIKTNRSPEFNMMNDLLGKNITLVESLSSLKKDHEYLKQELKETETREYRKETYANNLLVQRDDLTKQCDSLNKKIKNINTQLEDSNKTIFWQKFLFIFQILLTSYVMMAFNYNKILEYF